MSQPKVSIIVPVYNVERYLERCLDHGHAAYNAETGCWHLTPQGFLVSNTIITDLLLLQEESQPLARKR